MFPSLTTERLLLRQGREADIDALVERRNDPEVAAMQDWSLPFLREHAQAIVAGSEDPPVPPSDGRWMLTIADAADTEIFGDLFLRLHNDGRTAEVGYTLARAHWGSGYAVEALTALVDWLFDVQAVTRVHATMAPENLRSARVLETCGFVFEGHTRNSYWRESLNEDDWIYGLTPELRASWNDRPRHHPEKIELVEPYPTGLRHVVALGVHHSQERFVASIAVSLAQVAVPPFEEGFDGNPGDPRVVPWARIVHADGEPAGFVMVETPTEHNPDPYLWRLLIDRRHQRRGIGKRVVEMVIEQARQWGSEAISVSYVPGVGSPEPLYAAMGFVPTGEIEDGEIVARLRLRS